jgi:hypothetical protein
MNDSSKFSRRELLKGGLAVGVSTVANDSVPSVLPSVRSGEGWITLHHKNETLFELRADWFDGAPSIWLEEGSIGRIAFGLEGAHHRDLDLAADSTFELWEGPFGIAVAIHHHGLGIQFRGSVRDWLTDTGLAGYLGSVKTLADFACGRVVVKPGAAFLRSNASILFDGKTCISIPTRGMVVESTGAILHRDSKLLMRRAEQNWVLDAPRGDWSYDREEFLDTALLDRKRILFSSSGEFEIVPNQQIVGTDGEPLRFVMRDAAYSVDLANGDAELTAQLARANGVKFGPLRLGLDAPQNGPALRAGDKGCCVVAQGCWTGRIDTALVLPTSETSPWNVTLLSDKGKAQAYSDASLLIAGKTPQVKGRVQFRVLRPKDGLDVSFRMTNVKIVSVLGAFPEITIEHGGEDEFPLLIADLPAQAMIQEPILVSSAVDGDDCTNGATPPDKPGTRLSAPTRVSMRLIAKEDERIPLNLETLLQWARYPLFLDGRATQVPKEQPEGDQPKPVPPCVTEIVAPAGLSISPDESHAVFSSNAVRTDGPISQLWTARLSRRLDPVVGTSASGAATHFPVTTDRRPLLRPIHRHTLSDAAKMVLDDDDLKSIVSNLAGSSAPAKHCVLSSQGAWLDFGAQWPPPQTASADDRTSFQDKIAGAVEQSAQITFAARLCPSGHRVTVVKAAKLQWCRESPTSPVIAKYVERFKIVYENPTTISYSFFRTNPATQKNVQSPFSSITLIGKETPFLYAGPAESFTKSCSPSQQPVDYWALYESQDGTYKPYAFPVEIIDRANQRHKTTMQMLVACYNRAGDAQYNKTIVDWYSSDQRAYVDLHGERVAYAIPTKIGNTSYPTNRISLRAVPYVTGALDPLNVPWYPQMTSAEINLEQVSAFSTDQATVIRNCEYAQVYKNAPFDDMAQPPQSNRGEVILKVNNAAPFDFNGALGGGLAKPSSTVVGLGRKLGTLFSSTTADLDAALLKIGQTGMSVADIFGGLGAAASLLGAIDLADILDEVADGVAQASKLPQLAVQQIQDLENDAIVELNKVLAPLLNLPSTSKPIFDVLAAIGGRINSGFAALQGAEQLMVSLVRVLASEQRLQDIKSLVTETVDQSLNAPANNLLNRITLPIIERVQAATVFPGNVLPTLYVLRDYALQNVLSQSSPQVTAFSSNLDAALQTSEADFESTLDSVYASAGQAMQQLLQSAPIQLYAAINTFVSAATSQNVDAIVAALQNLTDSAAAIPTSTDAITTAITAYLDGQVSTLGGQLPGLLQSRTALFTQALNNVPNLGKDAQGNDVLQTIQNALGASGNIIASCSTLISYLDTQISTCRNVISDIVQAGTGLRNAFISQNIDIQQLTTDALALLGVPKKIEVDYTYSTTLHDAGSFVASYDGTAQSTFELNSSVLLDLSAPNPQFDVTAYVKNFRLNLIPSFEFVSIPFQQVSFSWTNGSQPVVDAQLNAKDIQFLGPLNFVANLATLLQLPSGLTAQLSGKGVIVGYNTALPDFEAGAFNIVGLSIYTAVQLNFDGSPLQAIFGFANPNQHFTITYFFLGGGGFLDLQFTPGSGTTDMAVTGAFEVGAMAALDFGVASGRVYAFLGVYFGLGPNDLVLSGYFRAGGEFDILGLISASLEFLMSLTYEDRGGQAWLSGDCEIEVDVHLLFVSESVTLHLHHDFSGTSMD